jgi:hypothetical protein
VATSSSSSSWSAVGKPHGGAVAAAAAAAAKLRGGGGGGGGGGGAPATSPRRRSTPPQPPPRRTEEAVAATLQLRHERQVRVTKTTPPSDVCHPVGSRAARNRAHRSQRNIRYKFGISDTGGCFPRPLQPGAPHGRSGIDVAGREALNAGRGFGFVGRCHTGGAATRQRAAAVAARQRCAGAHAARGGVPLTTAHSLRRGAWPPSTRDTHSQALL